MSLHRLVVSLDEPGPWQAESRTVTWCLIINLQISCWVALTLLLTTCGTPAETAATGQCAGTLNPSNAETTFVQSTRTQRFLKTIQTLPCWYSLDSSHWLLSDEYPCAQCQLYVHFDKGFKRFLCKYWNYHFKLLRYKKNRKLTWKMSGSMLEMNHKIL